ncbi:MAG: hypothetical protein ACO1RX_05695 [Candidatus Sericytochromatia bacterium]
MLSPFVLAALAALTPVQNQLKNLYSPAQWQPVANHLQAYANARSQKDVLNVYRQARKNEMVYAAPLQKKLDAFLQQNNPSQPLDFDWARQALPGLMLDQVAEGTMFVFYPDFKAFASLAARTPEAADNRFFALMQTLHGPVWDDYRKWMIQTWDYGGCSLLGTGRHTKMLGALNQEIKSGTPFAPELQAERNALLRDLTEAEGLCGPQTPAITELTQMLKSLSWSSAEKQSLNQRLQKLRQGQVPINQSPGGNREEE